MATTTRYVGTCAVCERRIKVRDGKLVHHGYERPGIGCILGDCFAVHLLPHEVSSATAQAFRTWSEQELVRLEARRAYVETAESLPYTYQVWEGIPSQKCDKTVNVARGAARTYEGTYGIPSFVDVQKGTLRRIAHEIESRQSDIERMTGHIDSWVEKPLTTVEEESERVTAELKAQRAAKKADRDAKKAGEKARRADRAAKVQVKIDAAKVKAQAILDAVDPSNVKAVRLAYLTVLRTNLKLPSGVQYTFYEEHLGRTELLKSAGLVHSHNARLMTHEHHVVELISGRQR